jgi:uncharacterized spore protein YtfJ
VKKQVSPAVIVIAIIVVLVVIFAVYKMTVGKNSGGGEPELPEGERPGMGPETPGAEMNPDASGEGTNAMPQGQPPSPPPGG